MRGEARSAYRFQESLEVSFSVRAGESTSSSFTPTSRRRGCKHHCEQALKGLQETFAAISKHGAKAQQNRMASYPTPKKQKVTHQNYTGRLPS